MPRIFVVEMLRLEIGTCAKWADDRNESGNRTDFEV